MLIIMMVVAAFLAGWLLITKRHGWGSLFLMVMLVCQGLLIVDAQQHFGTTIKTVTTTAKIAPITSAKGNHVLVTEQLKKGKTVYTAYATRKPSNQKVQLVLNRQKRVRVTYHAKRVAQVTSKRVYHYTNTAAQWLFSGVTNDGQLQRQTVTYQLNKHWHVLTKKQLTKLGKMLKQKSVKTAMKKTVTRQVTNEIKINPKLAKQQKTLVNQAEQRYISHLMTAVAK